MEERGEANAPTPNMNYETRQSVGLEYWRRIIPYTACIIPILYSDSFERVAMKPFADAS